jgi:uncharacterized protein (DUF302 family)
MMADEPTGDEALTADSTNIAASGTGSPGGVVTKVSPRSVGETVDRLTTLVGSRGMKVFCVIDHSREARDHGLELRDTVVVIFGNPVAGTPVMVAAPLAALDLPLKILVWTDGEQTRVTYVAPDELARRYDLTDELASRLAGINTLTDALVAVDSGTDGGSDDS